MADAALDWVEKAKSQTLTAQLARPGSDRGFGLSVNADNLITAVDAGSPADKAGLKVCDCITKVGDASAHGQRVLELVGKAATALTVERPSEAQRGAIMSNLRAANPHEQLTFVLSRDDADRWGIRTDDDNRVSGDLRHASGAVGLMPGDLIVRVGNQPVVGNVRGLILGKAYRAKLNLVVTVSAQAGENTLQVLFVPTTW